MSDREPRDVGLRRPWAERLVWGGADDPRGGAWIRAALGPAELVYRLAVAARNAAYDHGLLRAARPAIPTVVVGNLAVGGAGKTPFTAWLARDLLSAGRRPGVVLRGYGRDEPAAHALLNPGVPLIVDPNRVRAVAAASRAGAEIAVLDDAYQHRKLLATARIVLVAAESLRRAPALLPRGPWREPLSAARRADLIVVTRRSVDARSAAESEAELARHAPGVPRARVFLDSGDIREIVEGRLGERALDALRRAGGSAAPVAIAGVAQPDAVWEALDRLGVRCARRIALGDHHRYTHEQVRALTCLAGPAGILTTLKDAVKILPLAPAYRPLYVLTQEVRWETNREGWEALRDRLAAPRAAARPGGS